MKTIGMLGGMSWESTLSYYKIINESVRTSLGGLHSAKICLYSVDFDEIEKLQHQGKWSETADVLTASAMSVEAGGADFLIICTNTMHKVAERVGQQISIPILHIADATASQLLGENISTVGLIGTQFTMQQDFYKGRLSEKHGIQVLTPTEQQQKFIHEVIYTELCQGKIIDSSRAYYLKVINDLYARGAQAVILGCTEISLLVQQQDTSVSLFDTTEIHATEAVKFVLSN